MRDSDWGFVADLSDEAQIGAIFAEVEHRYGRLDILINCAGIGLHNPVPLIRTADIDLMWAVNARAPMLLSSAAFALMAKRGGGQILNVVSTAGLRGEASESCTAPPSSRCVGSPRRWQRKAGWSAFAFTASIPLASTPLSGTEQRRQAQE